MSEYKETIRLFDAEPYQTQFTAVILDVRPGKRPGTADAVLDETLFFPEEGGQTPDRGVLAGFPVVDVQIDQANVITHTLDVSGGDPHALAPGQTVTGSINWAHRYSNMQNHSGEHVLSGLLHSIYGYENVGFRLSDNTVTLDTSGHLTQEQLFDLETKANEVVWRNVPITCEYPPSEILKDLSYRSKKEIDGAVRIVTIEGVDVCACCAPHVGRTGEIGLIKILSAINSRGGSTRITLVCGARALQQVQLAQTQLETASHLMNEPQESVAEGVRRLQNEIAALKMQCREAEQRLIDAELQRIRAAAPSGEIIGRQDCWIFEGELSVLGQRAFMNRLCDMGWRYAGVFCGSDGDAFQADSPGQENRSPSSGPSSWKYLIGSRSADARIPNSVLKETFKARGGGKPDMVQGTVPARQEEIRRALDNNAPASVQRAEQIQ